MREFDHRDIHLGRALAGRDASGAFDVCRGSEEDQREAPGLVAVAGDFGEAEAVAEEAQRRIDIANTDHRVQELRGFHECDSFRLRMICFRFGGISV